MANTAFPARLVAPVSDFLKASLPSGVQPDSGIRSLHLNECAFPPSEKMIAAMAAALRSVHRYPDDAQKDLVQRIASDAGVDSARIVIGAGSSELLYASARLALEPGDEAVVPTPNFPAQPKAVALAGGQVVAVPTRPDGCVDVNAVVSAITDRCRLVFVTSPNNPTGGMLTAAEVTTLVAGVPDITFLHFDEAYYEFGRLAGGPDVLSALACRKGPWISTRTFSKAYGLAGIRLGYGLASDAAVAEAYRRIHINFNVNAVALAAGLVALDDDSYRDTLLCHVEEERTRLDAGLRELGLRTLPSAANFVTFMVDVDARHLVQRIARGGIYLMPVLFEDRRIGIRATVGTKPDNSAVLVALGRELLRKPPDRASRV